MRLANAEHRAVGKGSRDANRPCVPICELRIGGKGCHTHSQGEGVTTHILLCDLEPVWVLFDTSFVFLTSHRWRENTSCVTYRIKTVRPYRCMACTHTSCRLYFEFPQHSRLLSRPSSFLLVELACVALYKARIRTCTHQTGCNLANWSTLIHGQCGSKLDDMHLISKRAYLAMGSVSRCVV